MVVMKLRNVQNLNLLDLRQRILSCQDVCGRREQGRACQVHNINIFRSKSPKLSFTHFIASVFNKISQAIGSGWETYSRASGGPSDPGCAEDGSAASPGLQNDDDNGSGHLNSRNNTGPQVDEVIGIMHKNVENVLERDRKLGDLEERADALQDGCAQFEKQVPLQS